MTIVVDADEEWIHRALTRDAEGEGLEPGELDQKREEFTDGVMRRLDALEGDDEPE